LIFHCARPTRAFPGRALREHRRSSGFIPSPLLNLRSPADYSLGMEFPDLNDDLYMKVLQPLVDPYLVFWRIDIRHIKSLGLIPSQLDASSMP
jgi:hypothetical protein